MRPHTEAGHTVSEDVRAAGTGTRGGGGWGSGQSLAFPAGLAGSVMGAEGAGRIPTQWSTLLATVHAAVCNPRPPTRVLTESCTQHSPGGASIIQGFCAQEQVSHRP